MYCDDSEDAFKHFGHAIHDFIMLIWCIQSFLGGGDMLFDSATATAL